MSSKLTPVTPGRPEAVNTTWATASICGGPTNCPKVPPRFTVAVPPVMVAPRTVVWVVRALWSPAAVSASVGPATSALSTVARSGADTGTSRATGTRCPVGPMRKICTGTSIGDGAVVAVVVDTVGARRLKGMPWRFRAVGWLSTGTPQLAAATRTAPSATAPCHGRRRPITKSASRALPRGSSRQRAGRRCRPRRGARRRSGSRRRRRARSTPCPRAVVRARPRATVPAPCRW
jgi:hypothetical protein